MKKIEEALQDSSNDQARVEELWREKMKLDRVKSNISATVGTVIL
jgi:hypothetical protein